ncbi:MAG: alcohol dehydrogenase catalytic domain-containing protein, partial [Candidatus Hodarchaeales archaeon]
IIHIIMKAAVLEGVKNLVVKEIPTPIPTKDMALVKVKSCGICMTDYKAYSGERTNVNFPTICGHEFSGVVEQIGDNVKFFKPNDEIIASPVSNCGICEDCRRGKAQYCKNGAVIGEPLLVVTAWIQLLMVRLLSTFLFRKIHFIINLKILLLKQQR